MKFKSQVYTQASGSVGGLTYGRARGVMYTRGRGLVTNPNTPAQQVARNAFGTNSAAWRSLTPAQRTAWTTYAANTPTINALGDPITLTGQQMYVRTNSPLVNAGLPTIPDAPVTFGLTSLTPVQWIARSGSPGTLSAAVNPTDEWVTDGTGVLLVYASIQMGPAINFFKGPFFLIGVFVGNSLPLTTFSINPTYEAMNGTAGPLDLADGNKVVVRTIAYASDGRESQAQINSPIVNAPLAAAPVITSITPSTFSKAAGPTPFTVVGTGLAQLGNTTKLLAGATVFSTNNVVTGGGTQLTGTVDPTTLTIGVGTAEVDATYTNPSNTLPITVTA